MGHVWLHGRSRCAHTAGDAGRRMWRLAMSSKPSGTPYLRRSHAVRWVRRLLAERTLVVLILMFCSGVAIIVWHVSRLQANLIASISFTHAALYAQAVEAFRTLYTAE